MALTTAQLATLKAAILADPNLTGFIANGQDNAIAAYYNAPSATLAWLSSVSGAVMDDAAVYTTYDSLTQGKRDEWSIFLQYSPRDLTKNKNRGVITDVWGNATAGSVAEKVLQACTVFATVGEALFGGNVATTGTVSAIKRNFEGQISDVDVAKALRG